ncbi:hypothetical protein H4R19_002785 [Coemansia spiralis]|nr:hypothetical protein H4R19_002785 [Coemansia spiralis]
MVAGLSGRGHSRGLSASSSTLSSPSVAGWRLHLRGESLSFSKLPNHHIVHSSTQDEIDKLNGYLRTETRINSGPATRGKPGATHSLAAGRGLQSAGYNLDLGFGSWSMSALPGEQAGRHRRTDSKQQVKVRDIPYFLSPTDGGSAGTMSPPLSRQASAEHYHCSSSADLLAAQSPPPLYIVNSPPTASLDAPHGLSARLGPRVESLPQMARGQSMQELASRSLQGIRRGANTNSIIALYADDDGSAHTSNGSRRNSIPPIGTSGGMGTPQTAMTTRRGSEDSVLHPISAADTGFLSAVTALLPETPDTSSGRSPGEPRGCVEWHGLRVAEDQLAAQLAAQLAERELQHEHRLVAERRRHADELAQQRDAAQAQHGAELEATHAECDQLRALLEDCIATSEELVRQSEAERNGLARELGSATLERRRLEVQIGESHARTAALEAEQRAAQAHSRVLVADNVRLEELCATLRGDVVVAEQRNARIKEHAQDTLSRANAEISRLQTQADQAQKTAAELEARVAKAEARARSLNIQLTSTKQQNADLLALCEGF